MIFSFSIDLKVNMNSPCFTCITKLELVQMAKDSGIKIPKYRKPIIYHLLYPDKYFCSRHDHYELDKPPCFSCLNVMKLRRTANYHNIKNPWAIEKDKAYLSLFQKYYLCEYHDMDQIKNKCCGCVSIHVLEGKIKKDNIDDTDISFSSNNISYQKEVIYKLIYNKLFYCNFHDTNFNGNRYENEIWKPVKNFSNYTASDYGRIKNRKTRKFLNPSPRADGYIRYQLTNDQKKSIKILGHVIIADIFVPNSDEDLFLIDHINGDRSDNRASNLRWTNHVGNANNRTNKNKKHDKPGRTIIQTDLDGLFINKWSTINDAVRKMGFSRYEISRALDTKEPLNGFYWRDDIENYYLDGEIWRNVPLNTRQSFSVSNKGRIRNNDSGYVSAGGKTGGGYMQRKFALKNGEHRSMLVQKVVMLAFLGKPSDEKFQVDHIEGDKQNNNLEYLQYVTPSRNTKLSFQKGLNPTNKPVLQYLKGKLVGEYVSVTEAARLTNLTRDVITYSCKNPNSDSRKSDYKWKYRDE